VYSIANELILCINFSIMIRIFSCLTAFLIFCSAHSQVKSLWTEVNSSQKELSQREDTNSRFGEQRLYALNETEFKLSLANLHSGAVTGNSVVVSIPNSNGKMEQFTVVESSNFAPELQAKYPEIRAYSGIGISDPKASINFSVSPNGIQTMVLRGDSGSEFIEPSTENKSHYIVKTAKNRNKGDLPLTCKTVDVALNSSLVKKATNLKSNNGVFKTMRLALSCTAEYTTYFGGTVAKALAAMNATMTRVNGVFNKDLALKLEIIATNNLIVYTNAATDPYSDPTAGVNGAWNLELQKNLTTTIGNANYDIGHLFGDSGGGGDAGCIGCVCVDPSASVPAGKGSGFTSPSNGKPEGDSFDIDYVAHEMGHQLGANHTFSFDIEGTGVSVEPGSGSTIMGYAGITDYDIQSQSDDYFSYASILQIQSNLATKSCPISTIMNSQTPTVNAGQDYTIPKGTAFVLSGSGSDPNGNTLTYCWEQNDSATTNESGANCITYGAKPAGPNFRSLVPSTIASRYFPAYSKVLAGQLSTTWESVSTIGRSSNFVLTGRDNALLGSGQTNSDAMVVTVDGNKGPFAVTSQNLSDSSWALGSSQTITWSVNNTATLSGAANVNIKLSTDGGLTFPTFLATNTPNDGSEVITAPLTAAKNCRILIEPTANIFYAVNSKPFSVGYSVSTSCNSYAFAGGYAIPESTTYSEKTIIVPVSTSEITDVNFSVNFTHTYIADVQIDLVSPKGTIVKLFDKSCGATDSSLDLIYDDLGGVLSCGSTTIQTIVPAGILSTFNGESPGGTWKLRFRDTGAGDTGTINTASLNICSSSYATLATSSFEIKDFVLYPNPNNGNFTVRFTSSNATDIQIFATDLLGRKIFNKKYKNTGDFNENIQLINASAGTYIVTVVDGERKGVSKIIVE
jgi:subtilisin-like proprotein convertase family protein